MPGDERHVRGRSTRAGRAGAVFVAEDPCARRSDPAVARRPVRVSFFGDEVYCWTPVAEEIPEAVRAAARYRVNQFVMHAPAGLPEEISAAALAELAGMTTVVALDAYDGETFVLRRPRRRDPPPPHDGPGAER